MSMDLGVWSARPIRLPDDLPQDVDWTSYSEEHFEFEGEGWLIGVSAEEAEADALVSQHLPGARYRASVSLEPIGASEDGYRTLEVVVRHLSKVCGGVWTDANGHPSKHDSGGF